MTSHQSTEGSRRSPVSASSCSPSAVTPDVFSGAGARQASPPYQQQIVGGPEQQPQQQHETAPSSQLHYPVLAPVSDESRYPSLSSPREPPPVSGRGDSSGVGGGKQRPPQLQQLPGGSPAVCSLLPQDQFSYTSHNRSPDEGGAAVTALASFAPSSSAETQRVPQQQPAVGLPGQGGRGPGQQPQQHAATGARQLLGGCVQPVPPSLSSPQAMQPGLPQQQQLHMSQPPFQQPHSVQTPGVHPAQPPSEQPMQKQQQPSHALVHSVQPAGLPAGAGAAARQQQFQAPQGTQHALPQTHHRSVGLMRQAFYSSSTGSAPSSHQEQGTCAQQFPQQQPQQEGPSSQGGAGGVQQTPYLPRVPSQQGQSQRQSTSSFNNPQAHQPQQALTRQQEGGQQSQPLPTQGVLSQQGSLFQAPGEAAGQSLPAESLHQQGVQYRQHATQLLPEQASIPQGAFQRTPQAAPASSPLPDAVRQQQQSQLRQQTPRQPAHPQEQQQLSRPHTQSPSHPSVQAQRHQEQHQERQQQPQGQAPGASQLQNSPQHAQASKQPQLAHAHQPLLHQTLLRQTHQQQLLHPPPRQLQTRLQHGSLRLQQQRSQSPQPQHLQPQQPPSVLQVRHSPHQPQYHPLPSQSSSPTSLLHMQPTLFQSQQPPPLQSGYLYGKTQPPLQQPSGNATQQRVASSQFASPGESMCHQLGSSHNQVRHSLLPEAGNKSPKLERSSSCSQRRSSPADSDVGTEGSRESPCTPQTKQRPPKAEPGREDRGIDGVTSNREPQAALAFSEMRERDRDRTFAKAANAGTTGPAGEPVDGSGQERKGEGRKETGEVEKPGGGPKFLEVPCVVTRGVSGPEDREPGTGQGEVQGVKTEHGGGAEEDTESTDTRCKDRHRSARDAAMREDENSEAHAPKRMKANDPSRSDKSEDKKKRGGSSTAGVRGQSPGFAPWGEAGERDAGWRETGDSCGQEQAEEDTSEELREAETGFTLQDYYDFTEDVAALMGAFAGPHIEAMEAEAVDAMVRLCLQFIDDAVERALSIAIAIQSESSTSGPILIAPVQESVSPGLSSAPSAAGSSGFLVSDRPRTLDVKLLAEHCLLAFCNASRRKFNRCRQVLHTHRQVQQMLCAYDDSRMSSCSPIYPPPPPSVSPSATGGATETGTTGGTESSGNKKKKKMQSEAGVPLPGCREAGKESDERSVPPRGAKWGPDSPEESKEEIFSHAGN